MIRILMVVAAVAFVAAVALPPLLEERRRGELWTVLTLLVISTAIGLQLAVAPEWPPVARGLITTLQPVGEWLVGPEPP